MSLAQVMDSLFRNTLAPWQWALLAAVPPAIIALYFLKLRRQPLEVPSTFLWKKSIEDLHVNSLWQRMRQNILLLLQLLVVVLAMLALLRPGWEGTNLEGQRFIFLIDNSASMQATDADSADHRLAAAKALVAGLVDQMESGMTAMIISFADAPQVVQEFTDNRRLLRERIESIQPTFGTTNLGDALDLGDSLANPGRVWAEEEGMEVDVVEAEPATMFIFSDGRFEDVRDFSMGNLTPVYVPIGSLTADNLAITMIATRRSEVRPDQQQAFVQVTNFTSDPQDVVVELKFDGALIDAQRVELAAGDARGVVFPLADAADGFLQAELSYTLESGGQDVLPLDDVAYAPLNDPQPGNVLIVTPGNTALAVALSTPRAAKLANFQTVTPDYLSSDEYRAASAAGEYHLEIYDQCAPEAMPRANTLFIGRLPPAQAWYTAGHDDTEISTTTSDDDAAQEAEASDHVPQIIDWNRGHPLMAHVELSNVLVVESLRTHPPPGGTVLIDSTAGPIFAIAPRDSYQDAVLGFELLGADESGQLVPKTDWPRRHSFPTFWLNVLDYLAGQTVSSATGSVRPGAPVELRAAARFSELAVRGPNRDMTTVKRDEQDALQYHDTHWPGNYDVLAGDDVVQRFAVNLSDGDESNVRLKPSQDPAAEQLVADVRIGNIDVAATSGSLPSRKELWRPILLMALALLIVEWYIYNKRVYL